MRCEIAQNALLNWLGWAYVFPFLVGLGLRGGLGGGAFLSAFLLCLPTFFAISVWRVAAGASARLWLSPLAIRIIALACGVFGVAAIVLASLPGFATHLAPEFVDRWLRWAPWSHFVLGNWVRRMRRAAGREIPICEARLRRAPPQNIAPYSELFGPKVTFNAFEDSLALAREATAFTVLGANPMLRSILERQANAELEQLAPTRAFLLDARAALEAMLLDGVTHVDELSRRLRTSPRTLQRRLTACDTSFQALLDEVRHELALGHLARGRTVTETAFLLGFSELSAFSRAFRRWTGRPPRSYVRTATLA